MRSLDFETRSQIAKECICRACDESGRLAIEKRRRAENKRITRMLADKCNIAHSGTEVKLTVTSSFLNLTAIDSGEVGCCFCVFAFVILLRRRGAHG